MLFKKNIESAFAKFDDTWTPYIAGQINDTHIKLAKFEGEFIWHKHDHEDELFWVIEGCLLMELRDQATITVAPGEFLIVPRGVEHKPVAKIPTKVILLEPTTILNTGNTISALTIDQLGAV